MVKMIPIELKNSMIGTQLHRIELVWQQKPSIKLTKIMTSWWMPDFCTHYKLKVTDSNSNLTQWYQIQPNRTEIHVSIKSLHIGLHFCVFDLIQWPSYRGLAGTTRWSLVMVGYLAFALLIEYSLHWLIASITSIHAPTVMFPTPLMSWCSAIVNLISPHQLIRLTFSCSLFSR